VQTYFTSAELLPNYTRSQNDCQTATSKAGKGLRLLGVVFFTAPESTVLVEGEKRLQQHKFINLPP
jgi:hypothetical protein